MSNSPSNPKALLLRHGLRAKKSFGQNFLADEQLLSKTAALVSPDASVIEIGAGLGGLTRALLSAGHRVTAVERDRDMLPILREELADYTATGQLTLMEADAKQVDYALLFESMPRPRALVGNLPYNLSGPLLQTTCALAAAIDQGIFLLQQEVVDRLSAKPGSASYGALSVFTAAAYDVQRAFLVRRGAFYPQPSVDSAVVVLSAKSSPVVESEEFRDAVRTAFAQRRKVLRNNWQPLAARYHVSVEELGAATGINLNVRGETLGVADFLRVEQYLKQQARSA